VTPARGGPAPGTNAIAEYPAAGDRRPAVVIAGVSVRAMSESAARAGYRVLAVDAFGDRDLTAIADARCVIPYSADAVARTVAEATAAIGRVPVCYVSSFENHPELVAAMACGRPLWGNDARTLRLARDPARVADTWAAAGLPAPRVRARAPGTASPDRRRRWLEKPRASGGGHGIRPWVAGRPVSRRFVLQERIDGSPGSILFIADGRSAVTVALTRLLVGEPGLGAAPFRYCGNILAPASDPDWGSRSRLAEMAPALTSAATRAFGLVGANGVDVIARRRGARPVPIEVNPRFTAAMELVERQAGVSMFAAHAAACTGRLDALHRVAPAEAAVGKAIVFARRAVLVGDTDQWLADPDVRDIPAPGTTIPRGAPICTVFAEEATMAACYDALFARAGRIYAELE